MENKFHCQQCQNEIGILKKVGNVEYLEVNSILCREIRGFCSVCGKDFRYSISDLYLKELIKKNIPGPAANSV